MAELDERTQEQHAREERKENKRQNLGRGYAKAIQQTKDESLAAEQDGVEAADGRAARATSLAKRWVRKCGKILGSRMVPAESAQHEMTAFVESRAFNLFCALMILTNTCVIGIELDASWDAKQQNIESSVATYLHVAELCFCVFFIAEMWCRIHHHGAHFFHSWFNVGDFALVVVACFAFVVASVSGEDVRFVSLLRVLRILRLMRLLRLIHMFDGLLLVLNVMVRALRSLMWISIITVGIVYTCAMITTLLLGHNTDDMRSYWASSGWDANTYFGTVPRSCFSLVQVVTLDDWAEGIVRHANRQSEGAAVFFVLVIYVVNFGIMNLIVGTMVEMTLFYKEERIKKREKSQIERDKIIVKSLYETLRSMDVDRSLTITPEELDEALKEKEVSQKLMLMGFPMDDPHIIFRLCDVDRTGCLTIDDFLAGVLKLSGRGKSRDVFEVRFTVLKLQGCLADLEEECNKTSVKLLKLEDSANIVAEQSKQIFGPQQDARTHTRQGSVLWRSRSRKTANLRTSVGAICTGEAPEVDSD